MPRTITNFSATEGYSQAEPYEYDIYGVDSHVGINQLSAAGYTSCIGGQTCITASVSFYAFAVIPSPPPVEGPEPGDDGTVYEPNVKAFDDYGTGLVWREWTQWGAAKTGSGELVVSDQLGDPVTPNIPVQAWPSPEFDGDGVLVNEFKTGQSVTGFEVSQVVGRQSWAW